MTVVRMNENHIEEIARLEKQCFSAPWSEASLFEELSNPNAHFFVCEEKGEVCGYAGMHVVMREGYIDNIAVFHNHRRRGVATALVRKLMTCEVDFISLEVRESNESAVSLYKKLGFELVGRRKNFYENPREDALIYTLELKEAEK